jgi:hypothetical protein
VKDYDNPFRKMMYETEAEMESVLGSIDDNNFIKQEQEEANYFIEKVNKMVSLFK